jgi:hypothetical protein
MATSTIPLTQRGDPLRHRLRAGGLVRHERVGRGGRAKRRETLQILTTLQQRESRSVRRRHKGDRPARIVIDGLHRPERRVRRGALPAYQLAFDLPERSKRLADLDRRRGRRAIDDQTVGALRIVRLAKPCRAIGAAASAGRAVP